MQLKTKAFTLLELMVTIVIISLLLAVSGTTYVSYTVKSRFTEVLAMVNQYRNDLLVAYNDSDSFPSSFTNLTAATYVSLSSSVVQQVYYNIATNNKAAYLQFFTTDLGVSGYVAADNSGSGGVACRVTMATVINNTGQLEFYCGQWDGSSTDVPLTYLPKSCQDTNISSLIS